MEEKHKKCHYNLQSSIAKYSRGGTNEEVLHEQFDDHR